MKNRCRLIPFILSLALFAGCSGKADVPSDDVVYLDAVTLDEVTIEDEAVALAGAPAVQNLLLPEASGTAVEKNSKAIVDYSNVTDGYVMVQYTASTDKRLKVRVTGPTTQYTYDIQPGAWVTFPLSDGNGEYDVKVFENTSGTKYATILSKKFSVTLKDEFAPFLRPNQYVDYASAPNTLAEAEKLCEGITDPLKKVEAVYDFVVNNLTYDRNKAKTVKSGYLPVLDDVLAEKQGICFDYAALMTGMLRSQGVPCKLVVGYAGTAYHAWISVWSEADGWIDGAIFFDGTAWQRMDPTFASSGHSSESIMNYIGDGSNYSAKNFY